MLYFTREFLPVGWGVVGYPGSWWEAAKVCFWRRFVSESEGCPSSKLKLEDNKNKWLKTQCSNHMIKKFLEKKFLKEQLSKVAGLWL